MDTTRQNEIANWLALSPGYLSQLFNENRHLSWAMAERISGIVGLRPEVIIAATGDELRELLFKKYRAAKRRQKRETACA